MKTILVALLVAGGMVSVTGNGLAEPIVSTVTGVFGHDEEFVLQGSGFGEKAQAAPFRWDDFQDGAIGSMLPGRNLGDVDAIWDLQQYTYRRPTYSSDQQRYTGDVCALQDYSEANNKAIAVLEEDFTEMYATYWLYRDDYAGTAMDVTNCKLYGNWATGWSGAPESRWDEYWFNGTGHIGYVDCTTTTIMNDWSPAQPHIGEWIRIERYLDIGTQGATADGYTEGRINLAYHGGGSGNFWPAGCSGGPDTFRIGIYFRTEDGSGALLKQYISDMYVDVTRARVEIGNAATWDSCTYREIQIPNSWQPGLISVTLKTGPIGIGEQVFLYVVDGDGQPSDGFPLIVGNEYSGDGDLGPPTQPGEPHR